MKKLIFLILVLTFLLGATQTSFAARPYGKVDILTNYRIAGWAKDPDNYRSRLKIHIYRNSTFYKAITAGRYRSDVGYHSFDTSVSIPKGSYIRVFAIGVNSSGNYDRYNKLIGRNHRPSGHVDILRPKRIAGWARDSDNYRQLKIHIYVKGYFYKEVTANRYRSDVGYYAFDTRASITASNGVYVDVYAIGRDTLGNYDGYHRRIGHIDGFPGAFNSRVIGYRSAADGQRKLYMESNSWVPGYQKVGAVKVTGKGYYKYPNGYWKNFWSETLYSNRYNSTLKMYRAHVARKFTNPSRTAKFGQKGYHTFWNNGYKYKKGPTWKTFWW
ncbi:MAG: hypothetical protein E3J54_05510 [Actinobacteria bacterium]|nr:MAG: hypothetical protein E3J54_05510 [Actinomycetota bacterium]